MNNPLLAGFGKVDITPEPGHPPAFTVFDPIFFRALHLRQGAQQVTFLAADLFLLGEEFYQLLSEQLQGSDVDCRWILGGASHIGTCPILFHDYVNQPNAALRQFDRVERYVQAAAAAIRQAVADASEARVAAGTAEAPAELGFQRRSHDHTGNLVFLSLATYRSAPDDLVHAPYDQQFGVLAFERAGKRPIVFTNFGMHALTRYEHLGNISGDYPGRLCQMLDAEGIDALFFPGALGDVNPARIGENPTDYTAGTLADMARRILASLEPADAVPLHLAARTVPLPLRPFPNGLEAERAWQTRDQDPIKDGRNRYDYWKAQHFADQDTYPSRMCAVVLGSTVLLQVQGELFSETGRAIRQAVPLMNLFLLSDPCPEVGYIATPLAHREGGTEPTLSALRHDAEPLIREAAIAFLKEVAAHRPLENER